MTRAMLLLLPSVTLLLPASGNAGQTPVDPLVVTDVMRMLEAKVEEPVILAFLEGSTAGRRHSRPTRSSR